MIEETDNKLYAIFDKSGLIKRTYFGPHITENTLDGESNVIIDDSGFADPSRFYVENGIVTQRQKQETLIDKTTILANGVDVVTISNAPIGKFSATMIGGNAGAITDVGISNAQTTSATGDIAGTDVFSTTAVGRYKIKIESFPLIDFEVEIDAI